MPAPPSLESTATASRRRQSPLLNLRSSPAELIVALGADESREFRLRRVVRLTRLYRAAPARAPTCGRPAVLSTYTGAVQRRQERS